MLRRLFKAKWQHSDAAVRLSAAQAPEIEQSVLETLATGDPDRAVRTTAIGRLDNLRLLVGLAAISSPDSEAARQRLGDVLHQLGTSTEPATDQALLGEALTVCDDHERTLTLARDARSSVMRLAAVHQVTDQQALTEIASRDPSSEVRMAAAERVTSEALLRRIEKASRKRDKRLTHLLRERLNELKARAERRAEREHIIGELARRGNGKNWRSDESYWARIKVRWPDLEADAEDAQREAFLQVAGAFEQRLQRYLEERNRDDELKRRKEALLGDIRSLLQSPGDQDPQSAQARMEALKHAWTELHPAGDSAADQAMNAEFRELTDRFYTALPAIQHRARQRSTGLKILEQIEAQQAAKRLLPTEVHTLRKHAARFGKTAAADGCEALAQKIQDRLARLEGRLLSQQQDDERLSDELKKAVDGLEQSLEAEQLQSALKQHRRASELLEALTELPTARRRRLMARLHAAEPHLRRLKSWRHWGSDRAREALIQEAEAIAGATLEVDVRADRIHRLREQWKKLGHLDPGGKKLWEHFDAACTRAYQPVQEHRRQAAEQRLRNLEQRKGICERLEQLHQETDWNNPDWRSLDKAVHHLYGDWHNSGEVNRRDWTPIKRRFDQAVAALEVHLDKERRHNRLQREALVRQVQALSQETDLAKASEAAKAAQAEWRVTVTGKPGEERKLWRHFRSAVDGVFERQRSERESHRRKLETNLEHLQSLCVELEGFCGLNDQEVLARRGEAERIAQAYNANKPPSGRRQRTLDARFTQAEQAFHDKVRAAREASKERRLQTIAEYAGLCERLEDAVLDGRADQSLIDGLRGQWAVAPEIEHDTEAQQTLSKRFDMAAHAVADDTVRQSLVGSLDDNRALKERLCLDVEILLGRESPAEYQQARLERQVDMLAHALHDGPPPDRTEHVRAGGGPSCRA